MYDEFCAKDGPKANSEICTNTELSSYLVRLALRLRARILG